MFDIIIIGAGPAGLTAGIYSGRRKLKTLVLSRDVGGQAALSGETQNYPGIKSISGVGLARKMREHMLEYGVELKEGEKVSSIKKKGQEFKITSPPGEFSSRAVIIASGKNPRRLNVPGEKELEKKGVTYCATCDAPVFAGKTVVVVGGGDSALDSALQLSNYAEKIFLLTINPEIRGEKIIMEKVLGNKKVELYANAKTTKILGSNFVEGIEFEQDGKKRSLAVQGVFVEIGWLPSVDFAGGVKKNKWNEIIVDEKMETNIPGLFAAGDVTGVPFKQTIVAAGEGCKAALSAFEYLSKQK